MLSAAYIEAYGKKRHYESTQAFTQSTNQAIDANGYNFLSVQVFSWNLDPVAMDQFKVEVEESNVNEDGAYSVNAATGFSITVTSGAPTGNGTLNGFARFLRLKITPTITATYVGDLRVVFTLKQF